MGKKSRKGQSRAGGKHSKGGKGGSKAKKAAAPKQPKEQGSEQLGNQNAANVASIPISDETLLNKNGENGSKASPPPPTETTTTPAAGAADIAENKENAAVDKDALPPGLEASLSILTPSQQELVKSLCSPELRQSHLFEHWPSSPSTEATNNMKRSFVQQLEEMDKSYAAQGGLEGYISNARELLEKSRKGVNPLEGWKPSIPAGQIFELGTDEYADVESLGMKELGRVGFVLVAGGLGERLGYSDIKIGLPTEMSTETKYIQYYIGYILALQKKFAKPGTKLPLCIMTSGDTNAGTAKLLADNNYFGMVPSQVTIVQQGQGVPALTDNDAKIALDPMSQYKILAKPHGHGDIHALLYSHGVAKKWLAQGIDWVVFFQDTNGLAFHTLPLALGVSTKLDLVMNSLAVPRKAKQAIGGIAKLTNEETKENRTINVEYNQLDPLLRSTGYPDGDVNDEKTGFSPFPGNINQLLFKLKPYSETLEQTKGVMPEFVNPKYKDAEKTIFKKPTRLECMMQDFPTVLTGEMADKVGFTSTASDLCFSPVKNATTDGVALQAKGTHPGVAASGEADQYNAFREILRSIGCQVEDAKPETYSGITVVPGPAVVLMPDFACCPGECKVKFPTPSKVKISPRSTLVVNGSGVTIEGLDLDGALVIESEAGASGVIKDLVVKNAGWTRVADDSSSNEVIAMRGYHLEKKETKTIVFKKDGTADGYDVGSTVKELHTESKPIMDSTVKELPTESKPKQKESTVKELPTESKPVQKDSTVKESPIEPKPEQTSASKGISLTEPSPAETEDRQTDCLDSCVIL